MRVMIYGIGGEFAEKFVGCAHDATTGINLLRLLKNTGSYACSLHGDGLEDARAVSGEYDIDQATRIFRWAESAAAIKLLQET